MRGIFRFLEIFMLWGLAFKFLSWFISGLFGKNWIYFWIYLIIYLTFIFTSFHLLSEFFIFGIAFFFLHRLSVDRRYFISSRAVNIFFK